MNILNENISKKVIIVIVSILVLVVLSVSTTYSLIYNTKKFSNNSFTTGVLDIQYSSFDSLIFDNYIPISDEEGAIMDPYVITIKNTGSLSYKFDLAIMSTVLDIENIIDSKYLKIMVDEMEPVSLSSLSNGIIYSNLVLNSQEEMKVKIRMWLDLSTPNTEIGHVYSAKLVASGMAIHNSGTFHTTSSGYQNLVKLNLDKYVSNEENGIFEVSKGNDYVYYFRGNVDYNYVYFNDSYYRIISIDENGYARVIYAGKSIHENNTKDNNLDTVIEIAPYNYNNNDIKYSGYTYYDLNTREEDSNVKKLVDEWYLHNIYGTDNSKYVVDSVYCGDRRIDENNNFIVYDSIINDSNDLECNPADSYTVSSDLGNGLLKYPVGLVNANELKIIGNDYIDNGLSFWTMTSHSYLDNIVSNFYYKSGLVGGSVSEVIGIRPVITLDISNFIGSGVSDDPYRIG